MTVCSAALLGLATSLAPAGAAQPLLGMKIDQAKKTDFFTFFCLEQKASEKTSADGVMLTFKPGSAKFARLVTVRVTLDVEQTIRGMELELSRSFIDHSFDGVFARDIAKSMLIDTLPKADAAKVRDLINEIAHGKMPGRETVIISGRRPPKLPEQPTEGYQTFLGKRETFSRELVKTHLEMHNRKNDEAGATLTIAVREKS
jgi:hypothetical protein